MPREEKELSPLVHLQELRKRLLISVVALLVTTAVAFAFHERILIFLMGPADGFNQIPNSKPIFTEMTEMLSITFKVSLLTGLVGALPVILYELLMFASPGMTPRERRYLFLFMPGVILAFLAGASFGFYVLFPPMLGFLLNFGSEVATPLIRIGNYMNLFITLLFWMGLIFETPLVMFILAKLRIVSSKRLSRFRRYAIVGAFVLGAIITPTFDPINQSLVAIPIIVLYELGIWLAKLAEYSRHKKTPAAIDAPHH